jgi:hypothetical protein
VFLKSFFSTDLERKREREKQREKKTHLQPALKMRDWRRRGMFDPGVSGGDGGGRAWSGDGGGGPWASRG